MAVGRSQAELAKLREEFRARADQAFEQMFGTDGQNGLVTFTEREDRACEVTDALARWLMEEHLASDPAADPGGRWIVRSAAGRCGTSRRSRPSWRSGSFTRVGARSNTSGRPAVVRVAGRFFSLLDERLKLGTEGYSPRLLAKIEYAGANEGSFQQARRSLEVLAELSISTKHVWRITERLGQERGRQRDAAVAAMQAGDLKPGTPSRRWWRRFTWMRARSSCERPVAGRGFAGRTGRIRRWAVS